jgi:putative transposase
MVNSSFFNSGYYHIYNRGVEKRDIFMEKWDYLRFLETLAFYKKTPQPAKLSDFRRGKINLSYKGDQRDLVKILAYCLMPNHFHILLQQVADNGITNFISNLANSYTRYFNTKYDRVGALFQGASKAKLVETDEYLLQVSKYIHRNPFFLSRWKEKIYPFSSYRYYLFSEENPFCDENFILSYFSNSYPQLSYKTFVEESDFTEDLKMHALFIDEE